MTPLHPTIRTPFDGLAVRLDRRVSLMARIRTAPRSDDLVMVRRADGVFVAVYEAKPMAGVR